jgi:alpha-beta hydrolase superfamily lysophospholipase
MPPFPDQDVVSRVLFHPRKESGNVSHGARSVAVTVEPDLKVCGYLHLAGSTTRLLLLFHGNGELAADYHHVGSLFTQMGCSLLVMDYRGYGNSDGEPSTIHLLHDAVTIFDALPEILTQHGSQPERTFVMGRSLGSAAACEIASRRSEKLAGLIIESGFAFTGPLLLRIGLELGDYDEDRDGLGNGSKIASFSGPTLILHGQDDTLISPDQARTLYELSGAQNKRLVLIPNAHHNNLMSAGYPLYHAALQSFLE